MGANFSFLKSRILRWYLKKRADEKRALAEEKQAILRKQAEENRIGYIWAHKSEWGEEMCQWLIEKGINTNNNRITGIMEQIGDWGIETCQDLIQKKIGLGMTDKMVRLSLGEPTDIDNREISEKGEKFRWIYGIPRRGAAYIWFKDGVVIKIRH